MENELPDSNAGLSFTRNERDPFERFPCYFQPSRLGRWKLNPYFFRRLHRQAEQAAYAMKTAEIELATALQKVDYHCGHRHLGYRSLAKYVEKALRLEKSQADLFAAAVKYSQTDPDLFIKLKANRASVGTLKKRLRRATGKRLRDAAAEQVGKSILRQPTPEALWD